MRIALLCPDLLFGSKVEGALRAAGHEVTRFDGEEMARAAVPDSDLLVVDLGDPAYDGAAMGAEPLPTLGFYSHVDQETRRRADDAGFDLVVPRSRMAREMGQLVDGLAK